MGPARLFFFIALTAVLLAACAESDRLPASEPDIRGTVTQVVTESGHTRVLVEEEPDDSSGSAKAYVDLRDETELYKQKGQHLQTFERSELREGQVVRVWFRGPVLESYPVQAQAGVLVVER